MDHPGYGNVDSLKVSKAWTPESADPGEQNCWLYTYNILPSQILPFSSTNSQEYSKENWNGQPKQGPQNSLSHCGAPVSAYVVVPNEIGYVTTWHLTVLTLSIHMRVSVSSERRKREDETFLIRKLFQFFFLFAFGFA